MTLQILGWPADKTTLPRGISVISAMVFRNAGSLAKTIIEHGVPVKYGLCAQPLPPIAARVRNLMTSWANDHYRVA